MYPGRWQCVQGMNKWRRFAMSRDMICATVEAISIKMMVILNTLICIITSKVWLLFYNQRHTVRSYNCHCAVIVSAVVAGVIANDGTG